VTLFDDDLEFMTALVCTRNRGAELTDTVSSILASTYPHFELIVVDQSEDERTRRAVQPFSSDPRLRYLRSETQGLGRARNIGLTEARGSVVAMTDDDCVVPVHWLETMAAVFREYPAVAVAYCDVEPAPYDTLAGFVPSYECHRSQLFSGSRSKCAARGIGAGTAVRRDAVLAFGGFDEMLGAGALFPSCEDGDMTARALLFGHSVYETDAVAVCHAGFRTWKEGRQLARRDWVGIGAAYAKPLKCGYWRFAVVPATEFFQYALWPPLSDLLRGRKPRGFGRMVAFLRGFIQGLRTPVDPKTLRFCPPASVAGRTR